MKLSERFEVWRRTALLADSNGLLHDEILAALRKAEADEWRSMDDKPNAPTMCVFYATRMTLTDEDGNDVSPKMGPRDEAYELGYFEDGQFFFLDTGYAVFESPSDKEDLNKPTHWAPIPTPPEEKTCPKLMRPSWRKWRKLSVRPIGSIGRI